MFYRELTVSFDEITIGNVVMDDNKCNFSWGEVGVTRLFYGGH